MAEQNISITKNSFTLNSADPASIYEESGNYYLASKILFVIVLYNTQLANSSTFQSLEKNVQLLLPHSQVDLLICDNSPLPQVDISKIISNSFNIYYLYDSTNSGISLSYNRAVELATVKDKSWILVFDQDTILPKDGLKKYMDGLIKWPSFSVYVPKVYAKDLLLSPCRYFMYRGSPLSNVEVGINVMKGKNVINSGLLIAVGSYKLVGGYDENVWLYYSDFIFFNRLKQFYKKFIVIDLKIEHELSSSDYSDISFALKRFTYYCQGARAASESIGNIYAFIGHGITVALRSILMCRRFKNIIFLKVFYKNYFFVQK